MTASTGLRKRVADLFSDAIAASGAHSALADLQTVLERQRRAIDEPMRVAFVGKTNAGKSTLMNAFLGEELAPTGNGELTFNVSWLRYGEERRLLIHCIDGSVEEERFESLGQLTRRCEQNREILERIRYIEVQHPNPLLRRFDLIDTPGLHSFYAKDSRNTQALLNDPATRPHAVVFLFSGSLQEPDLRELENFHANSGSLMSGLTAIGAHTKVDEWQHGFDDAERCIRQLQSHHPAVHRYFYAILPIVAPAAFGAQTLTSEDRETLRGLASLDPARRQRLLRDVRTFCMREFPDEPSIPPATQRQHLFDRLGRYGIDAATSLLEKGTADSILPAALLSRSRVDALRALVMEHFGNRAFLIKACSALTLVRDQAFHDGETADARAAAVARQIAGRVDSVVANEARFREFQVLQHFYSGALDLPAPELAQLLEVTGERGVSCAERLGTGPDTPIEELLRLATRREVQWRERAVEPFTAIATREMARVLSSSYGEIRARVRDAIANPESAKVLLAYEL
jgi:hypothetical protein